MKDFVVACEGRAARICVVMPECAQVPAAGTAGKELRRCFTEMGLETPDVREGQPEAGEIGIRYDGGLGSDGLRVRISDGILWLEGGVRGVLYSAYEFLERLGWRFLTEDCEVRPTMPADGRITMPGNTDIRQEPVFEYRETYWCGATQAFAPRLRLNASLHGRIGKEYGGDVHYAGFVHTLGSLAEMEGDCTDRQPCLSDEKVFRTVVRNLRARLDADPEASIASVSQNDSHDFGRGCACDACRAKDDAEGTPMGSLLPFVNRVAAEIAPDYPHVSVDTLAYRYTRRAPATLQATDNVIVRLCSIECCFSHPIESCGAVSAATEDGSFAETLRSWRKHCRRIYIWDYTTNFRNYNAGFPNFNVLRPNVRLFAENNVRGVFEQGNGQSVNGEFGELRMYLLAKLLWDPYMSEETYQAHMDDFLYGYYGPGAGAIRRFLERMQRGAADTHFGIYFVDPTEIYVDPDTEGSRLERAEAFLRKGCADFAEAMDAARTEAEKTHIRKSAVQLDLYEWYVKKLELGASELADETELRAAGERLLASVRAAGIKRMHESRSQDPDFTVRPEDMTVSPAFWGA